jgi:hypothetical protein
MSKRVYTLEVYIVEGMMTEDFMKANSTVSRTIEIRGNQTLEQLHRAIFKAFDRYDEHWYEFQFGDRPHDPNGRRYVLPPEFEEPISGPNEPAGDVTDTMIDSLGLEVDQVFGYWFDFGDDWYHKIDVVAIGDPTPKVRYPRVTKRTGDSPPQYVDWDGEESEDDE